jgi:hypothetical protein
MWTLPCYLVKSNFDINRYNDELLGIMGEDMKVIKTGGIKDLLEYSSLFFLMIIDFFDKIITTIFNVK